MKYIVCLLFWCQQLYIIYEVLFFNINIKILETGTRIIIYNEIQKCSEEKNCYLLIVLNIILTTIIEIIVIVNMS